MIFFPLRFDIFHYCLAYNSLVFNAVFWSNSIYCCNWVLVSHFWLRYSPIRRDRVIWFLVDYGNMVHYKVFCWVQSTIDLNLAIPVHGFNYQSGTCFDNLLDWHCIKILSGTLDRSTWYPLEKKRKWKWMIYQVMPCFTSWDWCLVGLVNICWYISE